MTCHKFLLFVLNLWMVGGGSTMDLIDTMDSVPPLFELQDWARCQRAGDVYCILEAALVSGNQSTLQLLKPIYRSKRIIPNDQRTREINRALDKIREPRISSLKGITKPIYRSKRIIPNDQRTREINRALDKIREPRISSLKGITKDYSAETLRHFNRTLVHRGVCATRCGDTQGSAQERAQRCVSDSLRPYGFEAQFDSTRSLCVSSESRTMGGGRALAAVFGALILLATAATAAQLLTDRFGVKCPRSVLAFSLKRNWQILTYDRTKPRSDQRMKGVACMEGIRVLGIQCVIFAHVLLLTGTSFMDNPKFLEHMYESFTGQATMNSPVWLQAFFCLSGFLLSYSTLIGVEASPFTPLKAFVAIANRWIRLTPVAGIMLWFTISWLPQLGSGPLWAWYVEREAEACSERWWFHLLYVHNHLPLNKLCMGHTWYLAVDMQLHVLGIILLLVLVRYRRVALPILSALFACSAAAAGIVVYWYQLTPIITAQSPEDLRTLFSNSKILPNLYLPMWMNLVGYACGMAAAFILYEVQSKGIKLRDSKLFNLIFHLSLPIGTVVVWLGVWFLHDTLPPQWAAVVYSSLDRPLVALCFAIFMLGCVTKCKSALRSMFSWKGFHTLGRLSYCVFLTHFVILRVLVTNNPQLGHPTALSLISLLITASVLSHLAAIPLCLLAELPSIELFKALTEKERQPTPAPLDLVDTKRAEV